MEPTLARTESLVSLLTVLLSGNTHLFAEYWLSSLKVATIVVFIIVGILVNVGVNQEHRYIGGSNWRIPGAPFVGGFGGFARVFVTASFACTHCPRWCMFSCLRCMQLVAQKVSESRLVRLRTRPKICLGL